MYFINVTKFLDMEKAMRTGGQVDNSIEVLPYFDDESSAKINEYAILSHRWTQEEVNYVEMTGLAKMEEGERNKIRQRKGYHKISKGCELAGEDGYAWLWVDTCCIDKRSSAELSEAINSMYRWYQNSAVCYAHLHDVDGSFPTNPSEYWQFNGWPEWFSRGWTLQEMIAPDHLRFYNKNWKHIGDKKMLAHTLAGITGVPARVLADGLASNRPCVAQIMSWAANRTTSRVEDRAYSLLGLLDVNMPMLYGEGKKSFHRLQLEIIRMSNDQSIFAWSFSGEMGRTGCILADSPDFFRDCSQMELMKPDEFVQNLRFWLTETIEYFEPGILQQLHSVDKDLFGVYPVTNRGIHIWLPLSICIESPTSVFTAWLPCRSGSSDAVGIHLAVWESNYYRYHTTRPIGPPRPQGRTLELRQLHLRYQDMPHRDMIFEIDDRDIIEKGFTHCGVVPSHLTGKTKMITSNDLPCTIVYSDHRTNNNFAVGIGQCFDQDWMEVIYGQRTAGIGQLPSETYEKMVMSGPEHSKTMAEARSEGQCLTIMQSRPPWRSRWTVRTSCMVWEKSRKWRCGIKLETFEDSGFHNNLDKWTGFNVERTNLHRTMRDMRGLMICQDGSNSSLDHYTLLVDGVSMDFIPTPKGIELGDYGEFSSQSKFRQEGNIFDDIKSRSSMTDTTQRQHRIESKDEASNCVKVGLGNTGSGDILDQPFGLSLPTNPDFNEFLASRSAELTNRHLVTRVVQCAAVRSDCGPPATRFENLKTPLCFIAQPLVWYRAYNEAREREITTYAFGNFYYA